MTASVGGDVRFGAAGAVAPSRRTAARMRALARLPGGATRIGIRTGAAVARPSRV